MLRQKSVEQGNTIVELEKSLAVEKRTNELNEREIHLQKKIIEVKEMEIQGLNRNFDQMKEVADRAVKLAEISKPSLSGPLLTTIGIVLAAIIVGIAL